MNKNIHICIVMLIYVSLSMDAQIDTTQQLVTTEADGTRWIVVADIDGDDHNDVVSANKFGSSVSWFKNDGQGNFGPQQLIANLQETIFVHCADLDGDLDIDVLAVSGPNDLVVWYENLDGVGTFSAQNILSNTADGAYSVISADLDGDTDFDVISASDFTNTIEWYENLGGGNFASGQLISNSGNNGRYIVAVDIDGDKDQDIAATSQGSEILSWYENLDGLGNFGSAQVIGPAAPATANLVASDIDGDDDMDLVTVSLSEDRVSWYENLDGMGSFSTEKIISNNVTSARTVYSEDLDNDNDMDLVVGAGGSFDGLLVWFENTDGLGNFGPEKIIVDSTKHEGITGVYAADVDGDMDMDVFAASQNDDKIAWYKNLTILGTNDFTIEDLILFPNPTNGVIRISYSDTISEVRVYNSLNVIHTTIYGNPQEIDLAMASDGIYFIQIITDKRVFTKKILKH